MAKPIPLLPRHPERICWGCDRTQHPIETQGEDWYIAWGIEPNPERPSHAKR